MHDCVAWFVGFACFGFQAFLVTQTTTFVLDLFPAWVGKQSMQTLQSLQSLHDRIFYGIRSIFHAFIPVRFGTDRM